MSFTPYAPTKPAYEVNFGHNNFFSRVQEEKRRMKEEIERRRAEAAERRQKVGEEVDGEGSKPFKCVSPRGSSLKVSSNLTNMDPTQTKGFNTVLF